MISFRTLCILLLITAPILPNHFEHKELEQELFQKLTPDFSIDQDWKQILNAQLAAFNYENLIGESDSNALFLSYPAMQSKIPYISLGALPTPIIKLEELSNRYKSTIYLKNDALSGGVDANGAPLYGGNKVRKLEFLLAHARSVGATKVITFGCVGSNHAVATAVHARQLGMEPICMLKHQPPSDVVRHNLLMHLNYGSELHYSAHEDIRKLNTIMVWLDHYKKDGQVPYIIPTGGSNMIGTLGFVNAIFELAQQIDQGLMPEPTHIYVSCGSCATTAGLLLGCKATGLKTQIVAVTVEPGDDALFAHKIEQLFTQTNEYLHAIDASFPIFSYADAALIIEHDFAGPGYGIFTKESTHAAQELEESDGIILEGTYSAKAFAALLHDASKNPEMIALFWNTYSGLDFSNHLKSRNYTELPICFHDYFTQTALESFL